MQILGPLGAKAGMRLVAVVPDGLSERHDAAIRKDALEELAHRGSGRHGDVQVDPGHGRPRLLDLARWGMQEKFRLA